MKAQDIAYYMSLSLAEFTEIRKAPEGDMYVIDVVDWPGCKATGKTRDEAGRNLAKAKYEWLVSRSKQGLDVPLPRNVDKQTKIFEHAVIASRSIAAEAARERGIEVVPNDDEPLLEFVKRIIDAAQIVTGTKKSTRRKGSARRLAAVRA